VRLCLLALALICFAEEPGGPRILRPTDQSVLPPGPLSIVARADALKLDGKPLDAAHPAPGVSTAAVTPSPGPHELAAGSVIVKFFVGAGAPSGWKAFHAHPPGGAACDTCHAVVNGSWEIKGGVVGTNCLQCHNEKAFPKIHTHNADLLPDCQLCHMPHGSTIKAHLKMTREAACKQCHD
jgi:predicted CXXCH cytochrome family protein